MAKNSLAADIQNARKNAASQQVEAPQEKPATVYAPVEIEKPQPEAVRSEAPDVGDIVWTDRNHPTFPEDALVYPVYNTQTDRVRNERNGRYMTIEETNARTNFLIIEMSKTHQTRIGSVEIRPVAEGIKLPARISHCRKLLGQGFTIPDIIEHVAAMPKCGVDFWMAPVTKELIEQEKSALKHKLSKMGYEQAKAEARAQVGARQPNNVTFDAAVVQGTMVVE